ncbi:SDR family oxidoreductase [Streptomyces bomunensis]|uniref:SDR family oxidoreductase n=1 Tax=Streptomyces montanisoli TaxID=2798581 RepID=A0A940MFV7_9ACTN|nr:SDR family oxidoreductase [Streptomyces montanisoli]
MTGATGFLGSHLLIRLLERDCHVVALGRRDEHAAARSLTLALRSAGAGESTLARIPGQVTPVRVDFGRPRLGLPESRYHQLADAVSAVWHCAALTTLNGDPDALHLANVEGTRRVLAWAESGARRPHLHHISTAFVAGRWSHGVVPEERLPADGGFVTPYEESKHRAEELVHAWAADGGRSATVYRPSVLLSARRALPRAPRHTYAVLAAKMTLLTRQLAVAAPGGASREAGAPIDVRLLGDPDATVNLLAVQDAVASMLCLADRATRRPGVAVHHIVHPHDTPVSLVNAAIERTIPGLRLSLVTERNDPTDLERGLDAYGVDATAYLGLRRTYARAAPADLERRRITEPPRAIDSTYLDAALAPPTHVSRIPHPPHAPHAPNGQAAPTLRGQQA